MKPKPNKFVSGGEPYVLYDCPECYKTLPSKTALRLHCKVAHKEAAVKLPEVCGECNKIFNTKSEVLKHAKSHQKKIRI